MEHRFEYEFSAAFIGTALKRDMLWRGVYGTLAMLGIVAVLYVWSGQPRTTTLLVVGFGVVVMLLALYLVWRRAKRQLFDLWSNQSPDHVMAIALDDDGFDVAVGTSTSRYEWQGLRRLWRYDDVWLIEVVKNVSIFFPPSIPSEATRAYIVERCKNAGVRV